MVHNVGVDMAMWSVGVLVLSGAIKQEWRRAVFSPPLLAVVAAFFVRQVGWAPSFPAPLLQLAESLGQAAIPLGLVLGGAIIFDYLKAAQWRQNFSAVLAAIFVRQLILPAMMLGFAFATALDQSIDQVLLLQAAMPAATFPIVMVRLYQQDTGTALRTVLGTSLLGIVTIPLWMSLGHRLLFH
jgi:predicted permease